MWFAGSRSDLLLIAARWWQVRDDGREADRQQVIVRSGAATDLQEWAAVLDGSDRP